MLHVSCSVLHDFYRTNNKGDKDVKISNNEETTIIIFQIVSFFSFNNFLIFITYIVHGKKNK